MSSPKLLQYEFTSQEKCMKKQKKQNYNKAGNLDSATIYIRNLVLIPLSAYN